MMENMYITEFCPRELFYEIVMPLPNSSRLSQLYTILVNLGDDPLFLE